MVIIMATNAIFLYKPTGGYYYIDRTTATIVNDHFDPAFGEEKPYELVMATELHIVTQNVKLNGFKGSILIDKESNYWFKTKYTHELTALSTRRAKSQMH